MSEEGLAAILAAASAALRLPAAELTRRYTPLRALFVHLARRQGWSQTGRLALVTRTTAHAVREALTKDAPQGLTAAALCLGDPRLRKEIPGMNFGLQKYGSARFHDVDPLSDGIERSFLAHGDIR